ncbi:C-X-C chemokine receptor type 3-2-like [Podarcis raffonei]|uniref:C-X-C chemokine receptor type 3-2-like n=1 Tax=Podarcis raffonei TaxID=65483 RepID=UPI0023293BB9|nr:C-X-C chemokine receptor type 3-2-like [Podarcis raffonei]
MSDDWGDYSDYIEYPTGYPEIDPGTAPCTQDEVGAFSRYFGPAVFSVAFVVGLVGNGLVLAILGRRPCPWLFADCYLFQMAVADLLLTFTLPFRAVQFTQGWVFGEVSCKLVGAISTMNSYSTVFLLTCLSMERYLVIIHAMQLHHLVKLPHTYLLSALVWIACFGLSVVDLHFRSATYAPQAGAVICHLRFDAGQAESWRLGLRLVSFLFGFFLPLLVMAVCYFRVFHRLRQASIFCRHQAVRILLVILVLFVLCWAPFHGFIFVDSLQRLGHVARDCAREKILDFGLLFTESMGLVHCCLNPLVYALMGVKFRRELSMLFRCRDRDVECQRRISDWEFSQATEHTITRPIDYSIMM